MEKVPGSLEKEIGPYLATAAYFEERQPRVAYLLREHAIHKAHKQDPRSRGRGVRQFKLAWVERLEAENRPTAAQRMETTDFLEMENFYKEYYEKYIRNKDGNFSSYSDRPMLAAMEARLRILHEVYLAQGGSRDMGEASGNTPQVNAEVEDVPYNIIPLDRAARNQAIRKMSEIEAAINALRDTSGLQFASKRQRLRHEWEDLDIFDWLEDKFRFQNDNVRNQREHLILLLANVHVRLLTSNNKPEPLNVLDMRAVNEVVDKVLENYKSWCGYMHRDTGLAERQNEVDGPVAKKRKLIFTALFLLIWGEAGNLRFMPECLCYIFYHMVGEVTQMLGDPNVQSVYNRNVPGQPVDHNVGNSMFLDNVVKPIYNIVAEESKNARGNHSEWRNYDDLNEYFWDVRCFQELGWPMETDPRQTRFFALYKPRKKDDESREDAAQRAGIRTPSKVNFVEHRSFVHLFRSFDRMWIFLILLLQAMIIIASSTLPTAGKCDKLGNCIVDTIDVFKSVLSIFITESFLRLGISVLDILLASGMYKTLKWSTIVRMVLTLVYYFVWAILLTVSYAYMWTPEGDAASKDKVSTDGSGFDDTLRKWIGANIQNRSLFITAVILYLLPRMISVIMFFCPCVMNCLENTNLRAISSLLWFKQTHLYVGRGMHETQWNVFWYSLFWIAILICKMVFSYFLQVKPLVQATYYVTRLGSTNYVWHEFFPSNRKNIGAVLSIWSPVVLVYFFDLQIWYALFSTVVGGAVGAFQRLGEIRSLEGMRSRFNSVPGKFAANLIPPKEGEKKRFDLSELFQRASQAENKADMQNEAIFGQHWNEMILSLREEDLIDDSELELMKVPGVFEWPLFLLAGKIPIGIQLLQKYSKQGGKGIASMWRRFDADPYLRLAATEACDIFKFLMDEIVDRDANTPENIEEKEMINRLYSALSSRDRLLLNFKMKHLYEKDKKDKKTPGGVVNIVIALANALLPGSKETPSTLFNKVWDLCDKVDDMMQHLKPAERAAMAIPRPLRNLFRETSVRLPLREDRWISKFGSGSEAQLKRFKRLLNATSAEMEVPRNLEAQRRVTFFVNSVFMRMPNAPLVRDMKSFCVMTPFYSETVLYSVKEVEKVNEDGVSVLYYLQNIYPDEWKFFLERMERTLKTDEWKYFQKRIQSEEGDSTQDKKYEKVIRHLRLWTSYRSQTLQRTVRGMSYYHRALMFQAFIDVSANNYEGFDQKDIDAGFRAVLESSDEVKKDQRSTYARIQAKADIKFTYVVAAQIFGAQVDAETLKPNMDSKPGEDIKELMKTYNCLRVAYVEEVELETTDADGEKEMEYYSVLVKGDKRTVYRIKLPGMPKIGEGKPENQNHAIVFTRGEALQTIDMNQDNYLEEAFKMRNLLQEFDGGSKLFRRARTGCMQSNRKEGRAPTILGVREHIFTGSVSSLANFMSLQELSFVTLGQRVLATPLKVRFHYGHPDVFDRLFHITRGGISKASKSINVSEDIFAGFQTTLREGSVTHHEYIQVGKGRDVGMNQISVFEAKVAGGNGEQTISRDVYRLGQRFDFFRMLSMYYTTVGFYANTLVIVLTVYVFLYGRVYMALSGVEETIWKRAALTNNKGLQSALASQSLAQLGVLMALPMIMELGLERGFGTALMQFLTMQLQACSVFFTFSLGTKTHYFGRCLLHGGAGYKATGRGFVVKHEKFAENYRLYSRSHFVKALEILFLLTIYAAYSRVVEDGAVYVLVTVSMWFLVFSWLYAPMLFNPSGFEWQKTVEDWNDFLKWLHCRGGIGISDKESWESWWETEQAHLQQASFWGRMAEIVLALRFLLYQYGVVYHLNVTRKGVIKDQVENPLRNFRVYIISWLILFLILSIFKLMSMGRRKFGTELPVRFMKLAIVCLVVLTLSLLWAKTWFTVGDLFATLLCFIPTGWFVLQVSQAIRVSSRPGSSHLGWWDSVKGLGHLYEYLMGTVIFLPIAALAWFPFTNEFQSRILFNTAFSRGLQISRILAGTKKKD